MFVPRHCEERSDEAISPAIDRHALNPYNKVRIIIPYRRILMITAKVTSKGQVTIPKKVRDKLGIHPGENISFKEKGGAFYIKKSLKKSPFDKWMGKLKTLKVSKTDEIIDELRGR
jgi:AbrB family looped-hinge helix DNA binding protein